GGPHFSGEPRLAAEATGQRPPSREPRWLHPSALNWPEETAMTTAPETSGALAGVRGIHLTRVLGGPYCTPIRADHGADVVKVEPPQGDETRDWGPPFRGERAAYFEGVNRNKRSIALDLGRPEGREVLLRLLEGADVLIENFKPGSLEKWGLGYEE